MFPSFIPNVFQVMFSGNTQCAPWFPAKLIRTGNIPIYWQQPLSTSVKDALICIGPCMSRTINAWLALHMWRRSSKIWKCKFTMQGEIYCQTGILQKISKNNISQSFGYFRQGVHEMTTKCDGAHWKGALCREGHFGFSICTCRTFS